METVLALKSFPSNRPLYLLPSDDIIDAINQNRASFRLC